MNSKYLFSMLFLFFFTSIFSAEIKREQVYSLSMKKELPIVIVHPDKGNSQTFNTIYVLHGFSGNAERTLLSDFPNVATLADQTQTIFVLVDGNYSSWYVDSPLKKDSQYQTFIGKELVEYIDSNFATKKDKEHRGIIGWSMGGYGAINIGVTYHTVFGAVGSVCGALDFSAFEQLYKKYQIDQVLGPLETVANTFKTKYKIDRMKESNQFYVVDCGTEDPLLRLNQDFHQRLVEHRVPHIYIEQLGKHDTAYWSVVLTNQVVLFSNYFKN
ncbi:MAG: esterase family protein [Flavobacteriaceae bacterium]|jgi:S-formylglutathione hydrolase FrmB|nr:esterase family protein [Flavobacteriaceae bacterium]